MPKLYLNIPECGIEGCDNSGIYYLIWSGISICPECLQYVDVEGIDYA